MEKRKGKASERLPMWLLLSDHLDPNVILFFVAHFYKIVFSMDNYLNCSYSLQSLTGALSVMLLETDHCVLSNIFHPL